MVQKFINLIFSWCTVYICGYAALDFYLLFFFFFFLFLFLFIFFNSKPCSFFSWEKLSNNSLGVVRYIPQLNSYMVILTNKTQIILSFSSTINFNAVMCLNLIRELNVLHLRYCTQVFLLIFFFIHLGTLKPPSFL